MPSSEKSSVRDERRRVWTRDRAEVSGVAVVRRCEMCGQAAVGMEEGEMVRWEGLWGWKMHWGSVGGEEDEIEVGRRRVAGCY